MRALKSQLICSLLVLQAGMAGMAGLAAASDIIVIAHSGTEVSEAEVKDIFLGEKRRASGLRLQPVDNGSLQSAFSERVLRMQNDRYAIYWTKKTFRDGVNSPPLKGSDSEVISWVKATPGGIGYVSAAPADVKTVGRY